MTVECVWPVAATLGEGPLWSPREQVLWFVDIKQNHIHRFEPSTGAKRTYETPQSPGFIVETQDGFLVGLKSGIHRFDPARNSFTLLHAVDAEHPDNRLNDGALDRAGRLWFGTMDNNEAAPTGSLYRLDAGGPTKMDSGICITNGPCVSPDGRTLYHTDTLGKTIYAFDLDEGGGLSNKRVFAAIEEGAGYPDGPVCDAQGHLWTGLFGGWSARRYDPAGKLVSTVRFPCANITKLAFGGADLKTVYVTTAWKGLSDKARAEQPLAGGLFRFESNVAGL